ncbi:MAG: ABC transporter ATP-binding protein [Actinomycetota bacterium]
MSAPAGTTASSVHRRGTLIRLLGYFARRRLRLAIALVLLVAGSILMAFQPVVFGIAVDDLAQGDSSNIFLHGPLIIALAALSGLFSYLSNRQLAVLAQRAMEELRNDLFSTMQGLSLRFFDTQQAGDLDARITSDVEAINQFFSAAIARVISAVISIVTMVVIMISLDLLMTGVVLLVVPVAAGVMIVLGRRVQDDFSSFQTRVGELNGYVEEVVRGQKTVQAFARQSDTATDVRALSEQARVVDRSSQFLSYLMQPVVRVVNNLDVALVALIGGVRAIGGATSLGNVVSFVGYAQQFGGQMIQLSQVVSQVMSAIAGGRRVFEILDAEPDVTDAPDAAEMARADGKVDFNHVDFRYAPHKQILFDNDFHILPGQTVGLVGPTGAGKSTIINLLTRFYDIESGSIEIDDVDIVSIRLDDLRQRCGVVLQVPFLFSESVMYNLQYGREGATREQCVEAAKQANAHEFIQRLPQGYDTVLEGGESLSQGQRQLLTIARAIVSDPDVLVLDEATSSVDTRTERQIQAALDVLLTDRTSFVIAHRLSTIRDADQIIFIDAGRIVEIGSHEELMARRGAYFELYMEQFRPELLDALTAPG